MQNKPNLLNAQMNVNKVLTKDYENVRLHRRGKNKPNQTQPVVSLPAVSKVEPSNLSKNQTNAAAFDEVTKRRIISASVTQSAKQAVQYEQSV